MDRTRILAQEDCDTLYHCVLDPDIRMTTFSTYDPTTKSRTHSFTFENLNKTQSRVMNTLCALFRKWTHPFPTYAFVFDAGKSDATVQSVEKSSSSSSSSSARDYSNLEVKHFR